MVGRRSRRRVLEDAATDLKQEMEAYIELRASEFERQGMPPAAAVEAARAAFGDSERIRRECISVALEAAQRSGRREIVGTTWSDLKYAARALRRAPGFTFVAVLTLALGIGATTMMFSLVEGVLLAPLPYPDSGRLLRLFDSRESLPKFRMGPANFLDYRERSRSFTAMSAFYRADLHLTTEAGPIRLRGMQAAPGFFATLGVEPRLGRAFAADEELDGNHRVVILSHDSWRRYFAADESIIGRAVPLSGSEYVVVGVLPPGVSHVGGSQRSLPHGETVDVWSPLILGPEPFRRFSHYLDVIARVRPEVSIEEARADLDAVATVLQSEFPRSNRGWGVLAVPLRDEIVGDSSALLMTLFGAVGFVLLIACVNVANLMLARGTGRTTEVAVRRALGATRGQLARHVLTESLVLAALGAAAGTLVATAGVRGIEVVTLGQLPRTQNVEVNVVVLVFTLAATALAGLAFGVVPALRADRIDAAGCLRGGAWATRSGGRVRANTVLVVAEVALACVLLVGAGLLLRSFLAVTSVDAGFEADGALVGSISLPPARYPEPETAVAFYRDVLGEIGAIPGAIAVGLSSDVPWTGYRESTDFELIGRASAEDATYAQYHFASPGYFEAAGIPLVRGRTLEPSDDLEADSAVVVNEAFVRSYGQNGDSTIEILGARINLWGQQRTIVGIVGDVGASPTAAEVSPALWFPLLQRPLIPGGTDLVVTVRAAADPMALADSLRRAVLRADPEMPVSEVRPLTDVAAVATAERRFALTLLGGFALVALTLAVAGIYGVTAYSVGQRQQEIGIRMALGATPPSVVGLVVRQFLFPASLGVALGVVGAALLSRSLQALLYETESLDPATFASVALLLLLVAVVGAFVPARRAARVDPAASFD